MVGKLHVLRINLSSGKVSHEWLHEGWRLQLIGGKGVATRILFDELQPNIDPLSADNMLIFTVGPATGTVIPMDSRYGVFFKSPLTGIFCESYSGGSVAPVIRWAGLDAIVITGAADKPTYLYIDDGKAELRSAKRLWGLDTYTADREVKAELGDKNLKVISIGPAGENLVKFANMSNDYWRQAGRGGGGAVMGSKRLKAIAVRSSKRESPAEDSGELRKIAMEAFERIRKDPTASQIYRNYGTSAMIDVANELGAFPTRYWRENRFSEAKSINCDAVRRLLVKNKTCWNCPVACGKFVEAEGDDGATHRVELEYETIYAFGSLCMISKIEKIIEINDFCDRYGIDTITAGNVAAFAIEAYNLGKLKPEKPIRYGDSHSVLWLLKETVNRTGVGKILAEGTRAAAKALGLDDLAIHVKGLEPPGYDPRTMKGMALSYATSPRGACHLRSGFYYAEARGLVDRFSTDPKKVAMFVDWERRCTVFDSLILCRFGRFIFDWPMLARLVSRLNGCEYTEAELIHIADSIIDLTRAFNLREGISRKDDCIPERFSSEPVKVGRQEYVTTKHELNLMLDEYYRLHGWDSSGVPSRIPDKPIEK